MIHLVLTALWKHHYFHAPNEEANAQRNYSTGQGHQPLSGRMEFKSSLSSLQCLEHSTLCYCHLIINWNLVPCYLHGAHCPPLHYAPFTVPRYPSLCQFGKDAAFSSYLVSRISSWSVKQKVPVQGKIWFPGPAPGAEGKFSGVWITPTKRARGGVGCNFLPGSPKFILRVEVGEWESDERTKRGEREEYTFPFEESHPDLVPLSN